MIEYGAGWLVAGRDGRLYAVQFRVTGRIVVIGPGGLRIIEDGDWAAAEVMLDPESVVSVYGDVASGGYVDAGAEEDY